MGRREKGQGIAGGEKTSSLADDSHQYSREALGQGAPKESRARSFYLQAYQILSLVWQGTQSRQTLHG